MIKWFFVWVKLEDLVKEGATDKLRDDLPLELRLPYNTYYLNYYLYYY